MKDYSGGMDSLGRALVLLHGAGGDKVIWDPVRDILEKDGVPVLALDLPGHGNSQLHLCQAVEAIGENVWMRLKEIGVGEYVVAGHSLGGGVALSLGVLHAEGVKGVGVISSGGRLPVSPKILEGFKANFPETAARVARAAFPKTAPPNFMKGMEEDTLKAGPSRLCADFNACDTFALSEHALAALSVPVAILCGEEDRFTPLSLSQELLRQIPSSTLATLPGVGHMAHMEAPDKTAQVLGLLWKKVFPEGGLG